MASHTPKKLTKLYTFFALVSKRGQIKKQMPFLIFNALKLLISMIILFFRVWEVMKN